MDAYIVKYQPAFDSRPGASEPIIYRIFDSEEKAKKVVKEFPFMFYDEHSVE